MIYDLINPSDDVTFEAASFEAAVLAVWLVGDGHYGARHVDGEWREIPLGLFEDAAEWLAQFGLPGLNVALHQHRADVIKTLRSFATATLQDRGIYVATLEIISKPEERKAFKAMWDDRHRSSLNAITRRAHHLAESLDLACSCGIHKGQGYQCSNPTAAHDDLCDSCFESGCNYFVRRCE